MKNERLVVIGASGFIGSHLYDYCKKNKIDVVGTYCNNQKFNELIFFDMRKESYYDLCEKINNNLNKEAKTAVVLCSADTSIDNCKRNEKESYELNVSSTKKVINEIIKNNDKLIFISSEAVFDGKKGYYSEEDIPNPITIYGKQKYEIEQYITKMYKEAIIFRVSRAVGDKFGEQDIFNEFYKQIIEKEKIICLKNQSFCITDVNDIAKAIVLSIEKDLCGLFNLSSHNYINRYDIAMLYSDMIFGGYENIIEKDYSDIGFLDNRHILAGLNGEKLKKELGIEYRTTKEILDSYKETYLLRNVQEGD